MRFITSSALCALLCSCSQPAAVVEHRGSMFYGQNATTPYAAASSSPGYSPVTTYQPSSWHAVGKYAANADNAVVPTPTRSSPAASSTYRTAASSDTAHTASISSVSSRDLSAPAARISPAPAAEKTWQPKASVSTATSTAKPHFMVPVTGQVASGFGSKYKNTTNEGVNYRVPLGEPVYASAEGTVAYVGDELKSYGNMVILKHSGNFNTTYAHLGSMVVAKGSKVSQGQIIGYVGQTGNISEPELHFAIRKGTIAVNPSDYLERSMAASSY